MSLVNESTPTHVSRRIFSLCHPLVEVLLRSLTAQTEQQLMSGLFAVVCDKLASCSVSPNPAQLTHSTGALDLVGLAELLSHIDLSRQ